MWLSGRLRIEGRLNEGSRLQRTHEDENEAEQGLGFFVFFSLLMILYSILMYILLFTQAPIPVCLDGTIIDSSTILVTVYYCGYVGV